MRMRRWLSIAAVIAVVAGIVFLGARSWFAGNDEITVTAKFDNGAGLYVGNTVAVLGLEVGRVTAIEPQGTHVAVTMNIDGDMEIPSDAQAVAVSTSVLTDRHVELTPVYRGGDTLEDEAVIGLERTRTPIEFDRLIAMADTMALELQGDGEGNGAVAELLSAGASMTDGQGSSIRSALGTLSEALKIGPDGGTQTRNELTAIVDNLAVLSEAAAVNDQDIREFGAVTNQLSAVLAESGIGLGDTGSMINDILLQTNDLLTANRGAVQATATNAETLTRALADYQREIGEFLDLTPLLLNNAYHVMDRENGGARVHGLLERVALDGQLVKEVCNLMGMRDLGCDTGTVSDLGPDFGMSGMLEGLAGMHQ
ncbi:MCE family protein [Rhodococcus artemisiae]|uniref:MCE family protein n=1 Tax=Rhodococcus artemisiae TaxID=714159 RepID=A0ABU7LAX1_9NOCA|nr:MCE family protein [Rhodococcus artemisiae]MEE2058700.1 MCE family protein [Rhodococcus artemisiae]